MPELLWKYQDYDGLTLSEWEAIISYMTYNNADLVAEVVQGLDMTTGFKQFIADLIIGKCKRKPSAKPSNFTRNLILHDEICELMMCENIDLNSSRHESGAFAIIATAHGLTEEVVRKVYFSVEKAIKEIVK